MALDFPSSPTNGQVYGNFIWSSAKGAWQAKPLTSAKMAVSATAPSNPTLGDEWYNSNDGNAYVYYTDVDGSQWVQVKSDATLSSTLGNRVTTLETYPAGLVPIVPTSVTTASGTSSVGANGLVTFSGATTVSLNSCFTTAFKNYRVIISYTSANVNGLPYIRLRNAGSDSSVANYYFGGWSQRNSGSFGGWAGNGSSVFDIGRINNTSAQSIIDIFSPQESLVTKMAWNTAGFDSTSGIYVGGTGNYTPTTQFDGFTLLEGNGSNMGGTLQVYGYR